MALFSSKKDLFSIALVDIDSSSVGVALVQIQKDAPPIMYYSTREFIEPKEHEDSSAAMLRTLTEVTELLIKNGSPVLRQETGSGHIGRILVSIGAPWQKTQVRVEVVAETKPFVFSEAILSEITKKGVAVPAGYVKSGESVIATLLNGYETPKPFGKKVTRAELIILSSLLDKKVADAVEKILRKTYHTHALLLTTFASVSYTAFRDIFPHEKDFLVLEVSGEATDIVSVKRGLLMDVSTIPHGVNDLVRAERSGSEVAEIEKTWLATIEKTLKETAVRQALPRTLFLLADTEAREYLKRLLDSTSMRSLWLTSDPLRVISIVPAQFAEFVKTRGEAVGDVYLALLALYSKKSL
jgi:hypothetical protein